MRFSGSTSEVSGRYFEGFQWLSTRFAFDQRTLRVSFKKLSGDRAGAFWGCGPPMGPFCNPSQNKSNQTSNRKTKYNQGVLHETSNFD